VPDSCGYGWNKNNGVVVCKHNGKVSRYPYVNRPCWKRLSVRVNEVI
jgi:hypothetical protein